MLTDDKLEALLRQDAAQETPLADDGCWLVAFPCRRRWLCPWDGSSMFGRKIERSFGNQESKKSFFRLGSWVA